MATAIALVRKLRLPQAQSRLERLQMKQCVSEVNEPLSSAIEKDRLSAIEALLQRSKDNEPPQTR